MLGSWCCRCARGIVADVVADTLGLIEGHGRKIRADVSAAAAPAGAGMVADLAVQRQRAQGSSSLA